MSGRKRSEVNSVLRGAEEVREQISGSRLSRCEDLLNEAKAPLPDLEFPQQPQFTDESKKFYTTKCDELEARFIKARSINLKAEDAYQQERELNHCQQELNQINRNTKDLERELRERGDTDHYFNEEYAKAENIEKKNKDLLENRVKPLEKDLEKKVKKRNQRKHQNQQQLNEAGGIVKETLDTNRLADVRQHEQEVSYARIAVDQAFQNISAEQSRRFAEEEYSALFDLKQALESDEKRLLNQHQAFISQADELAVAVNEAYKVFLKKKSDTGLAIRQFKDRYEAKIITDATRKKDYPDGMSIAEYCRVVAKEDHCLREYQGALETLELAAANEEFDKAASLTDGVEQTLDQLVNWVDGRTRAMNDVYQTTQVIRDILVKNANYSARIDRLADETGGFRIATNYPADKPVYFEVRPGQAGGTEAAAPDGASTSTDIISNVDSLRGECVDNMEDLVEQLARNGINLTPKNWKRMTPEQNKKRIKEKGPGVLGGGTKAGRQQEKGSPEALRGGGNEVPPGY